MCNFSSRKTFRLGRELGLCLGFLSLACLEGSALEAAKPAAGPAADFDRDIRPILARRCLTCHGPEKHKGGLRLDKRSEALRGGASGQPLLQPGRSHESLLLQRVTTEDPDDRMPPKGKPLTSQQIALLARWIDSGAVWPDGHDPKRHWAFLPVREPRLPDVKNREWIRNPIDRFILAKLEEKNWSPSPDASPRALLRRTYLDLTGLPPALSEQEKFLSDSSPDRLPHLGAELLSRPAYGERWGRYWLDLVRYAESNGYERDGTKPHAWRYRDYVIDSFNRDKPYDRFILEQLAGDELPDASAETLTAAGYYRLGPWDDEPADPAQDRFDQLDDIVRTTSQVFLGVTLGCARCHDHKFDPLTAKDYYSMVAILNPLQRPQDGRSDLDLPAGSRAEFEAVAARDGNLALRQQKIESLRADARSAFLQSGKSRLPQAAIEAFRTEAKNQSGEQKALAAQHEKDLAAELAAAIPQEIRTTIAQLEREIERLKLETPDLPRSYFLHEPSPVPPKTHLLVRGRASNPGPEVEPAVPAVLASLPIQFLGPDQHTTRQRLSLARWIASPENPLTARVIVNRVWQFHFGEGLVSTPSDFGAMGSPPTHPELLEWLAHWFSHEGGWSLKRLHELILASHTYRMSKGWNEACGQTDPENKWLWRFPYRRLEVEAIRDSMLAVSGQLNTRMHGPSVYPFIPKEALEGHSDPAKAWEPFREKEASRRTIYAFVKRSLVIPLLEVLDVCDNTQSTDKRSVTSIAPQALTLFNGDFVNRQAAHLAHRLVKERGEDPAQQIEHAYRLLLCRPPTEREVTSMMQFLHREADPLRRESKAGASEIQARTEALQQMCRVLFNLNEFVYPD